MTTTGFFFVHILKLTAVYRIDKFSSTYNVF